MSDLLIAGLYRYLKRPLTYVCCAVSLICGIIYVISSVDVSYDGTHISFNPDDIFFIISILANIILCILSIGTEFSSGVIRNKITSGYKKPVVFISEVIITALISTIMFCLTTIPFVVYHISYFQKMAHLGLSLLLMFTAYISISVMIVFICFITTNRTISAIIGILLAFGLYFLSYSTTHMLKAPQFFTHYYLKNNESMTVEGTLTDISDEDDIVKIVQEKNPSYIGGIPRKIVTVINDCVPYTSISSFMTYCCYTNDSITIDERHEYEEEHHPEMLRHEASMCIVLSLIVIGGALIFKKKNLK